MPPKWIPKPKQKQIYNDETHRYLHAIGDPRSGKTNGFFHKAWKDIVTKPGIHGLITRDSGTSIQAFTHPQFMEIVDKNFILDSRAKPFPWYKFKNGSEVSFIPYDEIDISKAGGSEYGFIVIDEATRFSRKQWDYMDTRLSQRFGIWIAPDGKEIRNEIKHQWLGTTANPAGRGWTWKLYSVEHPLSYAHGDPTYRAWRFFIEDNMDNLPQAYVDAMRNKPDHIRRKILGANEDPIEGLVFPEFRREVHVLKNSKGFRPPINWKIYGGMDHGYQTPTVFLFMAVTEDGFIIFFREYRRSRQTVVENSTGILEMHKKLYDQGMSWMQSCRLDPSCTMVDGKSGSAKTTFNLYQEAGMTALRLMPAKRLKVQDRVDRMRDLLRNDPNKKRHPLTDESREEGWPTVFFTEDCDGDAELNGVKPDGGTISEMEEWEIREQSNSRKNAPEAPAEKDDHGPDAACYAIQVYFNDWAQEHPLTVEARENTEENRLRKTIAEDLDKSINKKQSRATGALQGGVY